MIAIVRWFLTVICLSTLLTWCFLNRGVVVFDWSPAHDPVRVPLFVVILVVAVIGFLWGAMITWLNAADERAERRILRREHKDLTQRLQDVERNITLKNPDAVIDGLLPAPKKGWFGR